MSAFNKPIKKTIQEAIQDVIVKKPGAGAGAPPFVATEYSDTGEYVPEQWVDNSITVRGFNNLFTVGSTDTRTPKGTETERLAVNAPNDFLQANVGEIELAGMFCRGDATNTMLALRFCFHPAARNTDKQAPDITGTTFYPFEVPRYFIKSLTFEKLTGTPMAAQTIDVHADAPSVCTITPNVPFDLDGSNLHGSGDNQWRLRGTRVDLNANQVNAEFTGGLAALYAALADGTFRITAVAETIEEPILYTGSFVSENWIDPDTTSDQDVHGYNNYYTDGASTTNEPKGTIITQPYFVSTSALEVSQSTDDAVIHAIAFWHNKTGNTFDMLLDTPSEDRDVGQVIHFDYVIVENAAKGLKFMSGILQRTNVVNNVQPDYDASNVYGGETHLAQRTQWNANEFAYYFGGIASWDSLFTAGDTITVTFVSTPNGYATF